jgi:anti-anti-sigma regulatory factor
MSAPVDVRVVEEGDGYIVEAKGQLHEGGVNALGCALSAVRAARTFAGQPLVVDLSEATSIDAECVGVLLGARRSWGGTRAAVVLRRPSGAVVATLMLAGLLGAFTLDTARRAAPWRVDTGSG